MIFRQSSDPAYLAIGTEVSAKYKGAFCEARVRKVDKEVKVRVNFKGFGLGNATLRYARYIVHSSWPTN